MPSLRTPVQRQRLGRRPSAGPPGAGTSGVPSRATPHLPAAIVQGGELRLLSPAVEALLGAHAPAVLAEAAETPAGARDVFEIEVVRRDGEHRVAEIRMRDTTWQGAPARLAIVEDVTRDRDRVAEDDARVGEVLARVAAELADRDDPATVLRVVARLAVQDLGCDMARSFAWAPAADAFVAVAAEGGPEPDEAPELRLPRWRIAGLLAGLERDDVLVSSPAAPYDPAFARALAALSCASAVVGALRRDGRIVGFFLAGSGKRGDAIGHRELRIARGLSRIASTALVRAYQASDAELLQRARTEYVAAMSHELRAPLHVICGFQSLLLEGDFGPVTPAQVDALQRIGKSANQLLELIDNTLNLNRIEAGKLVAELRDVPARDLLAEVELDTRDMRASSSLESVWVIPEALPLVRTDPQKLKLVLRNLIGNALKYTDAGRVTVSAAERNRGVEFAVIDTGIGIAPEAVRTIFEPFRQVRDRGSRDRGGVGLGLHIVQRLLELLGGAIRVDSRPGAGSAFRVWIPIADEAAVAERPAALDSAPQAE
jgi:signal transduction histidine kinase